LAQGLLAVGTTGSLKSAGAFPFLRSDELSADAVWCTACVGQCDSHKYCRRGATGCKNVDAQPAPWNHCANHSQWLVAGIRPALAVTLETNLNCGGERAGDTDDHNEAFGAADVCAVTDNAAGSFGVARCFFLHNCAAGPSPGVHDTGAGATECHPAAGSSDSHTEYPESAAAEGTAAFTHPTGPDDRAIAASAEPDKPDEPLRSPVPFSAEPDEPDEPFNRLAHNRHNNAAATPRCPSHCRSWPQSCYFGAEAIADLRAPTELDNDGRQTVAREALWRWIGFPSCRAYT